VRSERATLA